MKKQAARAKKPFWDVFDREIDRIKKTKIILFIMFVMPVLMGFVICEVFKSASPKDLPVAVYDADKTTLSRQYIRMLDNAPSGAVQYYPNNPEEGRKLLSAGKIYAFVVIPKNFKKDVTMGRMPEIVYYYNNQTLLVGGIISKDVAAATQTFLAGIKVKGLMKSGMGKKQAYDAVNLIKIDDHVRSNPYLNYSYFLTLAFICHVIQMFVMFTAIWAMGIEFKSCSAKAWLECAGNSIIIAFFAKILPYFLVYTTITLLIYFMYFVFYQGLFLGSVLSVILATILFIFSYQAIAVGFVAITSNLRLALSASAFYTALGFAFTGVTYPDISMPLLAKIFGDLMPLKHYLRILINQTMRDIAPVYDLKYYLSIAALALFGLMFLKRLKTVAGDEKYWRKT